MGYARHIGRIGALAVALGVGMAVATTPAIGYAETGDATSASDSPSTGGAAPGSDTSSPPGADDAASLDAAVGSDPTQSDGADDDAAPADEEADDGDVEAALDGEEDEEESSTPDADATPPGDRTDETSTAAGDSTRADLVTDSVVEEPATAALSRRTVAVGDVDDVGPTAEAPRREADAQPGHAEPPPTEATPTATTFVTVTTPSPPPPSPRPTLVTIVTEFVAAFLRPILSFGQGSPIQIPVLTAALAAVRNEFERALFPRTTKAAAQQTVSQLIDPTTQHVLVIGVDGTNLSRILADDYNQNFFTLMNTSTTAASSIVGHTTISNPSWSAILTGVWGERTGVINNVFTPWTYDRWSTVFNQLETLDPDIDTMAIGNWNVINAIAGAGSVPVDENVFIAQLPGDTDWLLTDDAVADATVAAIAAADAPNFLFSYYVGVDENGHLYGGASQQYKDAIRNMDDNLGEILAAVAARESATGEDWTILVVTDHGHQPQQGFGHGFQSPDETATFVIVDGPAFQDGYINLAYEIVDTTPTVVSLFGGTPGPWSDGVPLMSLSGSDVDPVDLHDALRDAIAANQYPDLITNIALSLRTIFATVPYLVYEFGNDISGDVPDFLALPVQLLFDGLYVTTNVPAQVVARLTGVSGARIFPLLPPPPPDFPSEESSAPETVVIGCADTSLSAKMCV